MIRPLPCYWILAAAAIGWLGGCGGNAPWGGQHARLASGLAAAQGIVLVAPRGAPSLERSVADALGRWSARGLAAERFADPGAPAPDGRARVVVGGPADPWMTPLLEALGVEDRGPRVALLGRRCPRPALRLVATWEDPQRPGLPLTVVCALDPGVRAKLLDRLHPGSRPQLWLWHGPEPLLQVGLTATGKVRHETFLDLTPGRTRWPERYLNRGEIGGRVARFHREVEPEQVDAIRASMVAAVERAERWVPAVEAALPEPALLVEAWMDDLGARGLGSSSLAFQHVGRHAIEVRLDAGAVLAAEHAAAEAASQRLDQRLGPAALAWLPRAAGIEAAGAYGGVDLEAWLQGGRGWPGTLGELLEGDPAGATPHERDPARALLVRLAIESAPQALVAAWRGEEAMDWAALEGRWRARMLPAEGLAPLPRGLRADLGGLGALVETPFDNRLGSLGSLASGAELARWAQRGLGRVALVLHVVPPGPPTSGLALGDRREWSAIGGDAAALAWLRRAGSLGMGATVVVSDLAAPSGIPAGDRVMGSSEEWRAYFEAQATAVAHAACLARMAGAEALGLAQGQTESLLTERDPATGEGASDDILAARRAGWGRSIEAAQALFPGALTVVRSGQAVKPVFGPGASLDVYCARMTGDLTTSEERAPAAGALLPERAALHLTATSERARALGQPWMLMPLELPLSPLAARGRQVHAGPADAHEARRVLGAWASALGLEQSAGRGPAAVFLRAGTLGALERQEGLGRNPLRSLIGLVGGTAGGSY